MLLSDAQLESTTVAGLAMLLASSDAIVRAQGASELVRRPVPAEVAWPILLPAFADPSPLVRRQLPKAAVFLGIPAEQSLPVLMSLRADPDRIVRSITEWALEQYGELSPLDAERAEPDAAADGGA